MESTIEETMSDSTFKEHIPQKHARLLRFASLSNIFAWIVFIVFCLYIVARYIELKNSYIISYVSFGQKFNLLEMISNDPLFATSLLVDLITIFFNGVVYWLVLKGISLGLKMIVETDLNYRNIFQEENNEQQPSQSNIQ